MSIIETAYARFSRKRFQLPSETQVRALEARIKIRLPADYREFILEFNGGYFTDPEIAPVVDGCPRDALTFLSGIGASHEGAELGNESDIYLFDDNFPPKILPIGATPLGSLIVLDTAPGEGNGEIHFKQAFGGFYFLAAGIEEFFRLLNTHPPSTGP